MAMAGRHVLAPGLAQLRVAARAHGAPSRALQLAKDQSHREHDCELFRHHGIQRTIRLKDSIVKFHDAITFFSWSLRCQRRLFVGGDLPMSVLIDGSCRFCGAASLPSVEAPWGLRTLPAASFADLF